MKKFARTICVLMLVAVLGISCFSLTACPNNNNGGNNGGGDNSANETRPLVFSVQELDNVFNPFFSTSGYDTEIMGNTQIGMMTSDADGKVYAGADEPTVALDYSQTIYYRENPSDTELTEYKNGAAPDLGSRKPEDISSDDYYTTYKLLIKNNIKFSDGQPLTIKDVIFNLYTYLDPAYYGSSTIYSTDIKGLLEYRLQNPEATDGQNTAFNQRMLQLANQRLTNMRYVYTKSEQRDNYRQNYPTLESRMNILKDVETVRLMFWDEINADYKAAEAQLESYLEENRKDGISDSELGFTDVWEIFLYNEQMISVTYEADGTIAKYESDVEAQGAYDKDGNPHKAGDKKINYADTYKWWHDKDSLIKIVFNEKMGITGDYGDYFFADEKAIKEEGQEPRPKSAEYAPKTDIVVDELGKAVGSTAKTTENTNAYWDLLWSSDKLLNNLYEIITYWATASNARDQFVAEEKENYFSDNSSNGDRLAVESIEGITVTKLQSGDVFEGQFDTHTITEDQYVLQIDINKVDPKAIWNFGFNVAPMHYYSNADNDTTGEFTAADDYRSFNYPGIDGYDPSKPISVGRPFGSKDYLDKVLKASNIISVPVGAGMYKVGSYDTHDENYTAAERPTFPQFSQNNVIYYIRNPYFYTTSGEGLDAENSSICNCKIKYIRYQVIASARLLDAVLSGQVHYGDPQAIKENMDKIQADENVESIQIDNNGYGYIGINPKYVPDREIRQAIMHAMNIELIKAYYGDFADLIYRPISSVSWASPQNENNERYGMDEYKHQYYEYYKTADGKADDEKIDEKIQSLILSVNKNSSYMKKGDVWARTLPDGTEHKLEYTFTIAGSSDDHPAYTTMQNAAAILNRNGFKITLKTDSMALTKLAAGTLTVWAAAWSSAIDPDMYQVYHMESSASSVRAWGYPEIIAGGSNDETYGDQYDIVDRLSQKIDAARAVLDNDTRADIYAEALDLVMDLAVELPTYQRDNLYAYRSDIIDSSTFNKRSTTYRGPLARLWEVSLI